MEFNKVNFAVLEECSNAAESKEAIFEIFKAASSFMLDSEIKVLKPDDLPECLKSLPSVMKITNEKAVVLILSMHALMKEYISVGKEDEAAFAARFPETFPKKVKVFLFKMMREVAEEAKAYYQDEFSSLPKMRDFDWRLDIKISSKDQDRIKQPVLYVKMDLEKDKSTLDDAQKQQVLFQVSKGQLKEILNNFETINQ